jgi:hypothetical protein
MILGGRALKTMESTQELVEELGDLVQQRRVSYEIWPEHLIVNGTGVRVGFSLDLCGREADGDELLVPGCPRCLRCFEDLRRIAEWIMPKKERASRYEIELFNGALRRTTKRGFRPEAVLTMRILHREGFDQPVDECERLCLDEMLKKLHELGVTEGRPALRSGSGSYRVASGE